jgi:hypothetical protein
MYYIVSRGFEYVLSMQYNTFCVEKLTGCSAAGSARGLGPWGRGFKSSHPDHQRKTRVCRYANPCFLWFYNIIQIGASYYHSLKG